MVNYKEILEQAKREKQKESGSERTEEKRESIQADLPVNLPISVLESRESHSVEEVNLCVRVPKPWRARVKALAAIQDTSLEKLVVEAIDHYIKAKGWH